MFYIYRFYFDFSASWFGLGMIPPDMQPQKSNPKFTTCGTIIYPFLQSKKGQWYHTENPSSLNGINGYKVSLNNAYVS